MMPANPQGTVEAARDHLAKWPQAMNREEFLVDVDVLVAATRADERARVRERVEDVRRTTASENDDTLYGEATMKSAILAAIDALGQP